MYCQQRLHTLNEFCVVCDEPHVFQNGAMLKVHLIILTYQSISLELNELKKTYTAKT